MNAIFSSALRRCLLPCVLMLPADPLMGEEELDFPACHQLTKKGIERLEGRLEMKFEQPLPGNTDLDVWLRQPAGMISVEGGKIWATRPFVNPWDGNGTVIWQIGSELRKLPEDGMSVDLTLDEHGEFLSVAIHRSGGNRWEDDERGSSQLEREDQEDGKAFFLRAMEIYHERATRAENPVEMRLWLAGMKRISLTIQDLRKEEGRRVEAEMNAGEKTAAKYMKPREPEAAQKMTLHALEQLPRKLEVEFTIPYPKDWQTEKKRRQPLARLAVKERKIFFTKPVVIDTEGTVLWGSGMMIWKDGLEEPVSLLGSATVNFDGKGELIEVSFTEGNDWSYDPEIRSARISRQKDEEGGQLLKRAIEVYRGKIGGASNPAQAEALLEGFRKVAEAMQTLRREEVTRLRGME